jgi:hypothetical protein
MSCGRSSKGSERGERDCERGGGGRRTLCRILNPQTSWPGDLAEDKALHDEWETKLVELSEAADDAANTMNTADLERQQLAGV